MGKINWPFVSRSALIRERDMRRRANGTIHKLEQKLDEERAFVKDRLEKTALARLSMRRDGTGRTYLITVALDEALLQSLWLMSDKNRLGMFVAHRIAEEMTRAELDMERG